MASKTQRSFNAGEIAPDLYGRSDLVQFGSGLAACRNFFVLKHGGVANRTGSGLIAEVKYSSLRTYLARFAFSPEQSYVIEIGDRYFRFFAQGAVVGVAGVPYELGTPYVAADLATLRLDAQSADVIVVTHPNYQPCELRRITETNWTLTLLSTAPSLAAPANLVGTPGAGSAFIYNYQVGAVLADSYEESLPTAPVTVVCDQPSPMAPNTFTWDPVAGAVEYNVYVSRDGNAFGFIGTTTSTHFDDVGYVPNFTFPPPEARLLFDTPGNYPSVAGYGQQRLVLASTANDPEKIWASKIGAYKNFAVGSPIQDDDAVTWVNAGSQVNEVRHLIELTRLFVLTSGGIWVIRGDDQGTLTPMTIYPQRVSHHGAAAVPPVIFGDVILYLQNRGRVLRGVNTADGSNPDLTLFAPHLLKRYTLERFAYAELPYSILWGVRQDGVLLSLTIVPEQQVLGWARHDTDGLYEDVAVVPEGNEDAVYVIVNRGGRRYVERFASREFTDIARDAIFVDSYLTYDGVPANTITGLDHLEGKTVSILADGNVVKPQKVIEGTVTLPQESSVVHVGLPITADIETLDLDLAAAELRDRKKRLSSVSLLVESSRGIFAGRDVDHLYEHKPKLTAYSTPPALLTQLIEIPIASDWAADGRLLVRQTDPLPLTVLAAIPNGDIGG